VSWSQDGCTYGEVATAAKGAGYNLQKMLSSLTDLKSFTQRSLDP
jgi:hypothetical protein